jgi:hypothetical protein
MARVIRLGDIGDYANSQMEKLLRAAVLETDSLLKQASPVDTGRFRASWQVGENAAGVIRCGPTAITKLLPCIQAIKPNRQANQRRPFRCAK